MKKRKRKLRCTKPSKILMRSSKEFSLLVNSVKADFLINGKKPPTTALITKAIAKQVKKEDVLKNEFIRFR